MSKIKIAVVVGILFLGLILRLHNYSVYPQRGASSDEYTYSFLGISLLTRHVPESWSNLSAYKNKYDLTIRNLYFPMVHPYFDHPPLNGLLVGGWSILNSQAVFDKVDLKTIRLVPIFLSLISSVLMFLLGLKLFGFRTAVWALLIYSTATLFVMNQRVVFAENLLTPLFLGALYIFSSIKKMRLVNAVIIGGICGLAFWTKELGIAVFFTMIYLFFEEQISKRFILILTAVFLIFFIGYIGYGYYYNGNLFWQVVSIQASRHIGPETLLLLTSSPVIVNKTYFDGWYFLGFLSIFFSMSDYKKYKMIVVSSLIYLLLMIFSLAKDGEMGWYMIPLFPFMALSAANFINESINKKNWFVFLLLLFVGLYEIRYLFEQAFGLVPIQFRTIIFILFVPSIIAFMFDKNRLFDILIKVWFYLLIAGTAFLTFNYIHPS